MTEILSNQSVFVGLCGLCLSSKRTGYDMDMSLLTYLASTLTLCQINREFLRGLVLPVFSAGGSAYLVLHFCNYPEHVIFLFGVTVFLNVCGCVSVKGNACHDGMWFKSNLTSSHRGKIKGFIFYAFLFLEN